MFKNKKKYLKDNRGFSLLEMVTAVAIFVVVVLIVIDIFLVATKSHRLVVESQKVQSDARFAMETMAREVRMDQIDYEYYENDVDGIVTEPETALALRDVVNDSSIIFKKSDDPSDCPNVASFPCLLIGNGLGSWQSITPAGVSLIHLYFYIWPDEDPFYLDEGPATWGYNGPAVQPRVTIILATKSIAPLPGSSTPETIYLQTTATSRVYQR